MSTHRSSRLSSEIRAQVSGLPGAARPELRLGPGARWQAGSRPAASRLLATGPYGGPTQVCLSPARRASWRGRFPARTGSGVQPRHGRAGADQARYPAAQYVRPTWPVSPGRSVRDRRVRTFFTVIKGTASGRASTKRAGPRKSAGPADDRARTGATWRASTAGQRRMQGYCPMPGWQSCPAPPRLGRPAPGNCPRAGLPRTSPPPAHRCNAHARTIRAASARVGRPPPGPESCHRARSPVKGATAFGLRVAARWRKRHPGPPTSRVENRHLSGGR